MGVFRQAKTGTPALPHMSQYSVFFHINSSFIIITTFIALLFSLSIKKSRTSYEN